MNKFGSFLCCIALLFSCIEIMPPEVCESETFHDYILSAYRKGTTVDNILISRNDCYIYLSGGGEYDISLDSLIVFTIDLSGGWQVNGVDSTSTIKDDVSIYEIMNSVADGHVSGSLVGISEGYTDWSFHFSGEEPVRLTKTLYSYDADAIMKSVNHRGYSSEAPENTLEAYRLSRLKGFKYAEADIRFTADGVPVLLHDATIDRTSNGYGEIKDLKLEEVKKYDFGSWKSLSFTGVQIPTLDEFLSLCVEIGLSPNIELKTGSLSQVRSVVEMVDSYGLADSVTYISFSLTILKRVLDNYPRANIGVLTNKVDDRIITNSLSIKTANNYVYIGSSDYGKTAVSLCRDANIPLSVWVIDSKQTILSLSNYISSVSSNSLHAGRVIYEASKKYRLLFDNSCDSISEQFY